MVFLILTTISLLLNWGVVFEKANGDVSTDEVQKTVDRLKIGKAAGMDEVAAEYIHSEGMCVCGIFHIARLFNVGLNHSCMYRGFNCGWVPS